MAKKISQGAAVASVPSGSQTFMNVADIMLELGLAGIMTENNFLRLLMKNQLFVNPIEPEAEVVFVDPVFVLVTEDDYIILWNRNKVMEFLEQLPAIDFSRLRPPVPGGMTKKEANKEFKVYAKELAEKMAGIVKPLKEDIELGADATEQLGALAAQFGGQEKLLAALGKIAQSSPSEAEAEDDDN